MIIFTDGSKRHIAYKISEMPTTILPIEGKTTNEAEYLALLAALCSPELFYWTSRALGTTITVCSDSEVMVRQLNGDYQTRNERLRKLRAEIFTQVLALGIRMIVVWLAREHNEAGIALEKYEKSAKEKA